MESPGKVSLHKKEELGLVSRHHIPTCKIIRLAVFNKRNPQFEWLDAYKYYISFVAVNEIHFEPGRDREDPSQSPVRIPIRSTRSYEVSVKSSVDCLVGFAE